MPGIAEINGEGRYTELNPANVDTQDARRRAWYEHNYDYRDELSWLHGNHLLQFGGDWLHEWWHFNRFDNVVGGLTSLIYEVSDSAVHMTPAYQPPTCGGAITTNCLDGGTLGASELSTWNQYYADILGIVDHSSIVDTRTGANLTLNPPGTPEASYVTVNTPDLYFTDTWPAAHADPNLRPQLGRADVALCPERHAGRHRRAGQQALHLRKLAGQPRQRRPGRQGLFAHHRLHSRRRAA